MRRGARYILAFTLALPTAGAAAIACSASSSPNPHDDLMNNAPPPATTTAMADGGPPGFPVMLDAAYYDSPPYMNNVPDGYAPLATCKACNCTLNPSSAPPAGDGGAGDDGGSATGDGGAPPGPPGYCIGGLPGDITPPASCAVTGTALALGCNAVPAACAGLAPKEACPCVLQHVSFGCYANCAVQGDGIAVYCPSP